MKKKIKILALSHVFVKKINLSFYENLAKNCNLDITCVAPYYIKNSNKKVYSDFKTYDGKIKVKKCKIRNNIPRYQYFEKIRNLIKKEKPNHIILDNDTVSVQSLILIFYSFFFKFDIYFFCNENDLKNITLKFTFKKFYKLIILYILNFLIKNKVKKIFCYSKQIKENYDLLGYKNKTVVTPLGYDEKIFFNKRKNKKRNDLTISYFGRIRYEKGIHVLIKSLSLIKNFKWKLLLDIDQIEDKLYFANIKKFLSNNFNKKRYHFIKCNHYQIANYLRKSDVLVLPSIYEEQYGRVLQEAVACGNVVIGSKKGAIPEIIRDKELLFYPGDHIRLSKIIKKLYTNKYYNKKFKYLHSSIISERTISKQVKIINKHIK